MSTEVASKVHEFFSKYPKREYPKGQILVFADENPEHIFYLTEGQVREYDVSYRGEEVIVNIFKAGAFFPMSWAINKTPNHYFFKTEKETELHAVPADAALQFLKDNPDVTLDLLARLYRGLDGLLGRVVHLMSGTAKSRLLYELIIECRRFGQQQPDGSYVIKANETDLAARSGLSRETVSREMHKIKKNSWVEVAKGSILVHDITLLENALGSEI
jgi:CRP/FNR family transcriptional regulator, cyclic AMP receptor protein